MNKKPLRSFKLNFRLAVISGLLSGLMLSTVVHAERISLSGLKAQIDSNDARITALEALPAPDAVRIDEVYLYFPGSTPPPGASACPAGSDIIEIVGANYDNGTTPVVSLGTSSSPLALCSFSKTTIYAALPAVQLQGDFRLTLKTGPETKQMDTVLLTVGATGPQGEQGPPGIVSAQNCPQGQAAVGVDEEGNLICDRFKPSCDPTSQQEALAFCQLQGWTNCEIVGNSVIGNDSTWRANCSAPESWQQYCFGDGPNADNCSVCTAGDTYRSHDPCSCNSPDQIISSWCN